MEEENVKQQSEQIINSERQGNGFGIASLVVSILSVVCFKFIFISIILAIIGTVLGMISKHKTNNLFANAGLTIGIISLIATFILFVVLNLFDTVLFYVPEWYNY